MSTSMNWKWKLKQGYLLLPSPGQKTGAEQLCIFKLQYPKQMSA